MEILIKKPKAWVAWSSGKDSAWALHTARLLGEVEVIGLMTTITDAYNRVSMHGTQRKLLQAQANALDLPLHEVNISATCTNEEYETRMQEALDIAASQGVQRIVFGDLFLGDVRVYREKNLSKTGIRGYFPLWLNDTAMLAQRMIQSGVQAKIVCLDPSKVPVSLAGHSFDQTFLSALPQTVDPCGEYGEFHSFVWDGPMFKHAIPIQTGETVEREGFVFTDLSLAKTPA